MDEQDWGRVEVRLIAGQLTAPQRRELRREYPIRVTNADWRVWPAMARRGLLAIVKGSGVIDLSAFGLAVREYLERAK